MSEPKTHYRFSASSAERWLECPASIILSEEAPPEKPSPYAAEGTLGHAVCEFLIAKKLGIRTVDAQGNDIATPEDATEEMISGAELYLATLEATGPLKDWHIEEKLVIVEDECGGTADAWYFDADFDELEVDDYKFGKGIEVFPNKPQTGIYMLGVTKKLGRIPKICRSKIVQPRLREGLKKVKPHIWTVEELENLEQRILKAIDLVKTRKAECKAGDWCGFCRAVTCSEKAKLMCAQVALDFPASEPSPVEAGKTQPKLLPAGKLTKAQRIGVLKWRKMIEKWLDDVQTFCDQEAIAGEVYEGFHLKPGRQTRKWSSDKDAVECLELCGLTKDQIFKDEIITVAQAEKIIGKEKAKTEFAPYLDIAHGKPTLVPSKGDFDD